MGQFSFISENIGVALIVPWHEETLCELQLVFKGKVIEKMRGVYNGYGSVLLDKEFKHLVLKDNQWIDITEHTVSNSGDVWTSFVWDDIVAIHFGSSSDGIAVWHLKNMEQTVPESVHKSKDDPEQGEPCFDFQDEDFDFQDEDDE